MPKFIRRLQKIGSSILVSLPKEWVDVNELSKGALVELETGQNTLTINLNTENRPSKEVVISYPLPKEENIVADITGAYLLGFDVINIKGKTAIPIEDRENIRNSMRRLVGMEIVDEDTLNVNVQFLLDATTLNPKKILRRMASIAFGMFNETVEGLISTDRSNLETLSNRDDEINRQYFLLVRLIRSTMVDRKLSSTYNLENIDILDYRIAANLLERAGDTIVELANSILNTSIPKNHLKKLYNLAKEIETIHKKSIDSFINNDRLLAIEAIKLHKKFQNQIIQIRSSLEQKEHIPIGFLDLVYVFDRLARSWADISDLVKPIYKELKLK